MRRRPQPYRLRPEPHRPIVFVACSVMEPDEDRHEIRDTDLPQGIAVQFPGRALDGPAISLQHPAMKAEGQEDGLQSSKFAARRHGLDAIGSAAGDRLDRERRIDAADRRKDRAVANPQVGDVPGAAVGIDDAGARVVAHARGTVEVTGVILLRPDIVRVNRLYDTSPICE